MSVKRPVYLKQLLFFPALALISIAFFSSCQQVTTATTGIGDWAVSNEYDGGQRAQAVCFVIANEAYVGLGYNQTTNTRYSDFFKFNETSHTWIPVANFPGAARNGAVAFTVNGKGYVTSGITTNGVYLHDTYEYNPSGDIWTKKADFPGTPRTGSVAFGIADSGYVISGEDSIPSFKKDMWVYDPSHDSWHAGADLGNTKRTNAVAFVFGGLGYVVTGQNNGTEATDLWVYNPATGSWTARRQIADFNDSTYDAAYGTLNIARSDASIFLINDTAYLTNGSNGSITATTWGYDIANDLWFQKTSFEGAARQDGIGFTVNNHGYFGLGFNGSTYYDDLWQFLPDAAQSNNNNNP